MIRGYARKRLSVLLLILWPLAVGVTQPLTIYCEDNPPAQIVNPDQPLGGFMVEIVREIQRVVGNRDPIQVVPWARGYEAVGTLPNVVLFSMARTNDRESLFQWVGPTRESGYGFIVKSDSGITVKSLDEAKSLQSVGVISNDVQDQFLTKNGFTNLDRVSNDRMNIRKLMSGRIEAYAGPVATFRTDFKDAGFKPGDGTLTYTFLRTRIYLAFSKTTSPAVVRAWAEALAALKTDGTVGRILKKYFPRDPGS